MPKVLLLFDCHGIAHPRGFGITSYLGLWLGIAPIGVANSRLYGHHGEVAPHFVDRSELRDESDRFVIGTVLRTRENT